MKLLVQESAPWKKRKKLSKSRVLLKLHWPLSSSIMCRAEKNSKLFWSLKSHLKIQEILGLFNQHPDFWFEKFRWVLDPGKISGSVNSALFRVITWKKLGLHYQLEKKIQVANKKHTLIFSSLDPKNYRWHPQNYFSGCRWKVWLFLIRQSFLYGVEDL